ncbi:hypothetical protein J3F83DRAFT_115450 [Trichoderma novae-zelandiae]
MKKFTFSRPARKKPQEPQPPPMPSTMPMSKAHKILGSTPLNIDSPHHDPKLPTVSVGMYDNKALDHADMNMPGDRRRNERQPSPSNRRLSALTDSMGFGAKNLPGTLKKAQSSSTIKAWHDMSKHSRSLSRQASIPVMNSSHSPNTQASPDADESPRSKKKPPRLDFTSMAPPLRTPGKESSTVNHSLPSASARTPVTTPYSATSHRQSDLRGMFKRRTKDSFRSFVTDSTPQSAVEGRRMTSHSSDNRLSTLYNHYEQMTFRDAMDEPGVMSSAAHKKELAGGQAESEWREAQARHNLDWLHKPISESQEPKPMAHSEYSSSPGDGARSVSSRHTRTSRASRQTDSGIIQGADFYDKSVLLLSSDSEQDEEDEDAKAPTRNHLPLPARPLTESSGHGQTRSARPRQASGREPSGEPPSKKTSFASPNVYIAAPGAERKRMSPSPSRLNPPLRDGSRASSPKPSVGSTNSTGSGMTGQIGYGAEDSHLTTVLPARRPSQAELDRQKALAQLTRGAGSSLRRESVATSSGQPEHETVPPSPTSVSRYLRSARSSVDDSASQGCVMTLTRQEEMLISALRKKTQAMREKSQLASASSPQSDPIPARRRVSGSSQVVTDSMLDFDFPAPPTHSLKSRQSAASSFMSTPITEHPYGEDDNYRAPSRLTADTGSERASFVSSIRGPEDFAEPQDVLVYLDQGKHSSGQWSQVGSDGQPVEEAALSSGFHPIPWDYPEEKPAAKPKGRVPLRHQGQADCMTPSKLTRLSEDGNEDMPRPDSPISNETFPQAQQQRRAVMNTARLSAVGFVRKDPELGWWGDDD